MSEVTPKPLPTISPIGDRVVIQPDVVPETTKGGICLPSNVVGRRLSRFGTVIAVGPGALRVFHNPAADSEGHRFPMQCVLGDRVILPAMAERVTMDPDDQESELVICPESQLLGIVHPAAD